MSRGHVRKRGSTWSVVVEIGRDPITKKRQQRWHSGYRTKGEANDALNEILGRMQAGIYVEPSKLTFGEYLDVHWLPARASNVRPSTLDSYKANVRIHVEPALGSVLLQRLTPSHLNAFYASLLKDRAGDKKALSPKTVRNIHVVIRKALADAQRWNLVARNVADQADPPKLALRSCGGCEELTGVRG